MLTIDFKQSNRLFIPDAYQSNAALCLGISSQLPSTNLHVGTGIDAPPTHAAMTAEVSFGTASSDDIAVERALFSSGFGAAAACQDGSVRVPVIDLGPTQSDEEISNKVMEAANTIGFFTVVNHGIPQELIQEAFRSSAEFFAQPKENKESGSPFARHLNCGYEFMSQVRPSTGTEDQKETIQVTARQCSMDDRWPSEPEAFRSTTERFMEANLKLAKRILNILQDATCPHLTTRGLIADSHTLWGKDGQCTLRYLHYPPIEEERLRKLLTPDAGGRIHWRAGPHTDWDNITLLHQQEPGLECCANPRIATKEHKWIPVDPVEGAIAVNIGDMLARWSDGKLYSNLHRVRMPLSGETSRYSIGFFAQSDKNTLISTPNSEPISAGDYLLSRIKSNFVK